MACGQAAAVIAGATLREGVPVMETDLEKIWSTLRQHGAIVPTAGGPASA